MHVAESIGEAQQFRLQWAEWMPGIELVIIESPYRSLIGPPLAYLDGLKAAYPRLADGGAAGVHPISLVGAAAAQYTAFASGLR